MRWTQIYIPTLREDPAEAELVSHKLLLRAGFMRKVTAGVYNYLPLMQRVLHKISDIVREEMNNAGALEITMPVLHPAEVWQASGRWDVVGKEQMRLKDRHQRDLVLGGTHEEIITSLIRGEVRSYRQLPLNMYQIQVKFRDEIRPRFGLMRGREFIMKDAYSFDRDEKGQKIAYQKMVDAYYNIFRRCGFDIRKVESDTGQMGGTGAHEFMVVVDTEGGENTIFYCDKCDYAANQDKATFVSDQRDETKEKKLPLEEVHTPDRKTIEEVTDFLKLPSQRLVKTLLYKADDQVVAALIRGDRQINEIKLKNETRCLELLMADAPTVESVTGSEVGFAGPCNLKGVKFFVDEEVGRMANFVTGANKTDYHLKNVNPGRDFVIDHLADIKMAEEDGVCPRCKKGRLKTDRGIEVGNTFMLGTKYSAALKAHFVDEDGKERPFVMGSYGVGITRTAQAAVERFNDKYGIIWPKPIAPFDIVITPTNYQDEKLRKVADQLHQELEEKGLEVLLDDRDERAGVKFNDADLIGFPLRVTVGEKGVSKGQVEARVRLTGEVTNIDLKGAADKIAEIYERID
jgi:prolyl-tRNA synthetase